MILAKGKLFDSREQDFILKHLESEINQTRMTETLSINQVMIAMDKLSQKIEGGVFNSKISLIGLDNIEKNIKAAVQMLRRENLEYKISTELGCDFFSTKETAPPFNQDRMTIRPMPLGTLFHIAAGNMDGLPAFSVAEGLLTGNVNILKLPQADNGLSIEILLELIKIEPQISHFVYVFDTPSSDLRAMKKMAKIADGIVVWGGDAAVSAVRQLAPVGTRIIEWGHKLGFAYVSGFTDKEFELTSLAQHILSTKQLLCSSCQTIFIDTQNLEDVYQFCREFLPYLEKAAQEHPVNVIGASAEISLRRYNSMLEQILSGDADTKSKVFQGKHCSLTACEDSQLELSNMFGHCLVKRLPKQKLFTCLRRKKGYLQTAGLICSADKRKELTDLLASCGVVRIMSVGKMSEAFSGEAHDGEYPLRRYTRIVNIEN